MGAPALPARRPSASPCGPEALGSPARGSPLPASLPGPRPSPPPPIQPRDPPLLPRRPWERQVYRQGSGWPGSGARPRTLPPRGQAPGAAGASSPGLRFAEQPCRLPWKASRGPSGPGCVFLQAWGSGVPRPPSPGSGLFCSPPAWQPGGLGQPLLLKA